MSKKILLVVPEAPAVQAAAGASHRVLDSNGLRMGTLDNSKGNADHLLQFVAEGLKAALPIKSMVSLRKGSVSLPAPGDVLDQLTREADFVVGAMAD